MEPPLSASSNHITTEHIPSLACPVRGVLRDQGSQASPFASRLAQCLRRIEFTFVPAHRFAAGCSPPRLTATQLPFASGAHTSIGIRLSRSDFIHLITH